MSCALATIMMRIGIEDRIKRDNKCSSSCDDCDEHEDDYGADDAHADLIVWHVIIIITMYMLILERRTSLLRKVLYETCSTILQLGFR